MKLAEFYGDIEIHREEKIVYARLIAAHRVLSTCRSSTGAYAYCLGPQRHGHGRPRG